MNGGPKTVNREQSRVFRRFTIYDSRFTIHDSRSTVSPFTVPCSRLRNYVLHSLLCAATKMPPGAPGVSAKMFAGAHHTAVLYVVAGAGGGAFDFAAAGLHFTFGSVVVFLRACGQRGERQD